MFSLYAALFLAIAFTAKCELQDGPCPKPTATDWQAMKDKLPIKRTWYVLSSNFYKAKDPNYARKCFEISIEEVDGKYLSTFSYTDSHGEHTQEVKFVPSPDLTFDTKIKNSDGEWVPFGWHYTPIAFEDSKYSLEHICKEEGDKHEDFYAIFGLDKNIPDDVADKFKMQVKDHGDEREFVVYNHENC